METVTHENQGSGDRLRLNRARAECGVAPDHQGLLVAVNDQSCGRPVAENTRYIELYGLIVPIDAGRLESRGVELRDHVLRGSQVAFGTGEAPFHALIGEYLHMGPPCLACRLVSGSDRPTLS